MRQEIWRVWRDGDYAVSSFGRIKRVKAKRGAVVGRILRQGWVKEYRHICLYVKEKKCGFLVHKLVAEVFLGPCPIGKEVNHKDTDKTNNGYWNLEYLTGLQNKQHAARLGLTNLGEKNCSAKLTSKKVRRIRKMHASGRFSFNALGRKFGVRGGTISAVVTGRNWSRVV